MRTKQELFRAAKDRLAEQHQRALSRAWNRFCSRMIWGIRVPNKAASAG